MEYKDKYLFDDFTLSNYRRLLEIALGRFVFTDYHHYKEADSRFIILRHDLEFAPPLALEIAKIEHELGICSTTFVNIHSEYYNCLERRTFDTLEQLRKMGHSIEIHFDVHFHKVKSKDELENALELEKKLFKLMLGIEARSFSFHNTTPEVLNFSSHHYASLINVYSAELKKDMNYCADSTGYWRYERLEDVLKDEGTFGLQLLIHDGMWQTEPMAPRRRVYKAIDDQAAWLKNYYDDTLIKFKAKNVDHNQILLSQE